MNAAARMPDFFTLFGLPQCYRIDRAALEQRYRELQRAVHPDRFASAGDRERRLSMQQAADVNQAYQTLTDPLGRARYLLELRGYPFEDQSRTTADSGFLLEQMELREALDEVRRVPEPLPALEELSARVKAGAALLETALTAALDQSGDLESAFAAFLKLQFFTRLQSEIDELQMELEDSMY